MRLFDAEPKIIDDFKDEAKLIAAKDHAVFKVFALRHPTLGKVIIVEDKDGSGIIVETEE